MKILAILGFILRRFESGPSHECYFVADDVVLRFCTKNVKPSHHGSLTLFTFVLR